MPVWTDEQLRDAIEAGDIGAITLDTSVFDQADCNLTYRPFESLSQFRGTGVTYLLTDVVVGEVKAHIRDRAREADVQLRAAAREFGQAWQAPDVQVAFAQATQPYPDPAASAQAQLDRYQTKTGFLALPSAGRVDVNRLLQQYFEPRPPFEEKSGKKEEFPDAIALQALEHWATEHETIVLAISRDGGWKRFAAASDCLVWVNDLRATLGVFNEEDTFVAKRIVASINNRTLPGLVDAVTGAVESTAYNLNPHIEAETSLPYDSDYEGIGAVEWTEIDLDSVVAVDADEDSISLSFEVTVTFEVEATFTFMVRDEDDYIPIGSSAEAAQHTMVMQVTLAVTRERDDPEVLEVQATAPRRFTVDFGRVEPDYRDYEE